MDLIQADIRNMEVEPEHVFTVVVTVGVFIGSFVRDISKFITQLRSTLESGISVLGRFGNKGDRGVFRQKVAHIWHSPGVDGTPGAAAMEQTGKGGTLWLA